MMQQSDFSTRLRRRGNLTRRNNGISWRFSGELRAGHLGVWIHYAGRDRLRWVRKNEDDDRVRYPVTVPLFMEF